MITAQILLKYNIKPIKLRLYSNYKRDPFETPKINTVIPSTPRDPGPAILTYRSKDTFTYVISYVANNNRILLVLKVKFHVSENIVETELTNSLQGYTLKYKDKVRDKEEKTLIEYTTELKEIPIFLRPEYIELIVKKQGVRDALVTLSRELLRLKP
jgi:hypothetical protein